MSRHTNIASLQLGGVVVTVKANAAVADLTEDKGQLLQCAGNTTLTDGVSRYAGSKCLSAEIWIIRRYVTWWRRVDIVGNTKEKCVSVWSTSKCRMWFQNLWISLPQVRWLNQNRDMRRFRTGIGSEKCVVRAISSLCKRHGVHLHKTRQYCLLYICVA